MAERWLPIPGYEGLYEVSDLGRIKSLPRTTTRGGVLKAFVTSPGYYSVKLWRDGIGRTARVHALVALAFLGERQAGHVTRHLNGDPLDNRLSNLEYGTYRDNNLDAVAHGTNANTRKTHCDWGHEFTPENTIPNGPAGRGCRECRRRIGREYHQRRKARESA